MPSVHDSVQKFIDETDFTQYDPIRGLKCLHPHILDWLVCNYGHLIGQAIDDGWSILMYRNFPGFTSHEKKVLSMTRESREEAYTAQSLVHELSHALDPIFHYKSLSSWEDLSLLYKEELKAYTEGYKCLEKMPKSFYKSSFYTKQHVKQIKLHGVEKYAKLGAVLDIQNRLRGGNNMALLFNKDIKRKPKHAQLNKKALPIDMTMLDHLYGELVSLGMNI